MNMFVSTAAVAASPALATDLPEIANRSTRTIRAVDGPTLADLIQKLAVTKAGAEDACTMLSNTEEKYRAADGSLAKIKRPKVAGGLSEPVTITVGGVVKSDFGPSEWFFQDRKQVKKEGTAEQLAEWDRQARAARRAYPKELRVAEREHGHAMDAWTAAERALASYKPTSAAEAVELLTLAGKPQERGTLYLDIDQWAFQDLVANCAAALRNALTN